MEKKRIVRGNTSTAQDLGPQITGSYLTQAISAKDALGKGNVPYADEEDVIAAKDFVDENHK